MGGEFAEKVIGADVTGVVLQCGAISEAGEVIANGSADSFFLNSQDGAFGDEVGVGVIEFEESLEDLAGALVDFANARVVVKIFGKEGAEVLDFDAHGQGKGEQAATGGLGIGGAGGGEFAQIGSGGAGGVLHEVIGEAAGYEAASTLGIKAGIIFANRGFGFFPQFDPEKGGGFNEAAFDGVFQIVATVGDFVGEVDGLGFEGGLGLGARQGIEALADFVSEVEAIEFWVFYF